MQIAHGTHSIHGAPETPAEQFAAMLERDLGIMLDPGRHKLLCERIEEFVNSQMPAVNVAVKPKSEKKAKAE